MMYRLTKDAEIKVESFLYLAKKPQNLVQWFIDLEDKAYNAFSQGESCVVLELKAHETVLGHTETLYLNRSDFTSELDREIDE